jgi:hypothetical protein
VLLLENREKKDFFSFGPLLEFFERLLDPMDA